MVPVTLHDDDLEDFDEFEEIGRLVTRGYIECGWCSTWHHKDKECPRCWKLYHSDEPADK